MRTSLTVLLCLLFFYLFLFFLLFLLLWTLWRFAWIYTLFVIFEEFLLFCYSYSLNPFLLLFLLFLFLNSTLLLFFNQWCWSKVIASVNRPIFLINIIQLILPFPLQFLLIHLLLLFPSNIPLPLHMQRPTIPLFNLINRIHKIFIFMIIQSLQCNIFQIGTNRFSIINKTIRYLK